ncbi:MAG TPA: NAD(P)H-dependent oxidoreductase [Pseudonocardiaceae bacterium]|jgi:FMN-dependent NADH-azoreductase
MPHLLHIDASLRTTGSVSREVSAAFAAQWRAAHPDGEYTYRDLGRHPIPHLDEAALVASQIPPEQHTPEQRAAWAVTAAVIAELEAADTVLLGVPMYNFSIPSTVKAWVDRIVTTRLMADPETGIGPVAGKRVIVTTARGGAYGPGTPREPYEFQESYLRAVFTKLGLDQNLTFVNTELTLADVVPAMARFQDLAVHSRAEAHRVVQELAGVPISV